MESKKSHEQDAIDIWEVEKLLKKLTPPDKLLIVHAPSVEPGSCHGGETERIEEIREDLRDRGERIAGVLKRLRTANAKWAYTLITHAIYRHDAELAAIGQKLADCTCTCGKPADPI
ncbi:MAG: hypothetical protein HOI59_11865 [Nitrospina sp.]|jgi:hypothetical protein|nr:hypothetical protein [Nitrospina sp.]MBT3414119.1 hypothetical protein [Nitrospina sp.]MBT3857917.1 hypothetical protein [Nitrospina sp.]MBT4103645.1 hypothetical protein [Nitrospina sp.]MBT4389825.1 hypothetical protein [Nitrospina sp.]